MAHAESNTNKSSKPADPQTSTSGEQSSGKNDTGSPKSPTYEEQLEDLYDRLDNPDPERLEKTLNSMKRNLALIEPKWAKSPYRQTVLEFITNKVLSVSDFHIANALCLGLGTLEDVQREEYRTEEDPRAEFWEKNFGFFQVLMFETVVNALRERFAIQRVAFQDPEFSAADVAFLAQRGHTVIPYPAREMAKTTKQLGKPFDQKSLQPFADGLFLFAPSLDMRVKLPTLLALKPPLFLGNDYAGITTSCILAKSSLAPLVKEFEPTIWSCDWEPVPALGNNMGFHWPADATDKGSLDRIREIVRENEEDDAQLREAFKRWDEHKEARRQAPAEALRMELEEEEVCRLERKFQGFWEKRAEKEEFSELGKET